MGRGRGIVSQAAPCYACDSLVVGSAAFWPCSTFRADAGR